jgi:osmoprotectant transport system permease protein
MTDRITPLTLRINAAVILFAGLALLIFSGSSLAQGTATVAAPAAMSVGSKRFTESYVLAEIIRQAAIRGGETPVVHRQGLGNTAIVLNALNTGGIDIYPEYTGTIAREILKLDGVPPLAALNRSLAPLGLAASIPLGFNNTYALAMRADAARDLGISRLSDLKAHPGLRLGLSQEFIGRADGWPGLRQAYALPWTTPRGLDHGLAYEAIARGEVDVIDIYSTDAKIASYHLIVLTDDAHYFPRYDAVLLHKADLPARHPAAWAALTALEGRINDDAIRGMNAAAELEKKSFEQVAADFLAGTKAGDAVPLVIPKRTAANDFWSVLFGPDLGRLAIEHLTLVFLALAASVLIGVPLGVVCARHARTGTVILGITGVLQTIPALAMLAILIPLTGRIGFLPAFIALAIYALLPIVRNTHAGITQVPAGMRQAAQSLGMTPALVLQLIELPLARPTILAGVKTSAVISVGTATIAAFIGAGGFGERIVTGLALNDHALLLAGAIPVALIAIFIEAAFGLWERAATPAGMRTTPR